MKLKRGEAVLNLLGSHSPPSVTATDEGTGEEKENSDTTNKSVLPSSAEETRQSDDPMIVLIELLLVGKSGRPGGILNGSEGISEVVEYLLLQCAEHNAFAAAQVLLGPAFNAKGLVPVTLFDGAGRTAQAVGSNSNDPKIVDLFKTIGEWQERHQ